jgi:hypothetical protein
MDGLNRALSQEKDGNRPKKNLTGKESGGMLSAEE